MDRHPLESLPVETLAEGKFLRLAQRGPWEFVERVNTSGAVVIVAVTLDDKLVLVEQYRVPLARYVIELPAGLVGDIQGQEHEALVTAAERELLEETGFQAARFEELATGPTTAGLADEVVTFLLASGLERRHDGGGDEHEEIVVHEVPLAEITARLRDFEAAGKPVDTKIFTGLYFLAQRR
ncbi:MAG: NUDIX hydrolase [Planctomycetaceae bacterium]|nr:NUDIX hydrolase [Planctomycetaceae bacterium]